MEAIQNCKSKDVTSCDVCGGKATETTFEFMSFKREVHSKDHMDLTKYTFVAYISK